VPVPIGKTLQQVTLLHGSNLIGSSSQFYAVLNFTLLRPNLTNGFLFSKNDAASLGPNIVVSTPLMQQIGKAYPDQFVVDADHIYHVTVTLNGEAILWGMQITYN
jgi:hypothetical protein